MAPSRHHAGTIPVPRTPAPPAGCGHAPAATRPVTIRPITTRPAPAARGSEDGRGVGHRPPVCGGGRESGPDVGSGSGCHSRYWEGVGLGVPVWGGEGGTRGGAEAPMWGEDQGIAPQFGRLRSGARCWQWVWDLVGATIPLLVKPSSRGDRARSSPLGPSPFWGMFHFLIKRPLPP